jgi:hypothetical protein
VLGRALLMNGQTSELFFCRGSIEGHQFVAPSIPTAPDSIPCTRIGQPYTGRGSCDARTGQRHREGGQDAEPASRNLQLEECFLGTFSRDSRRKTLRQMHIRSEPGLPGRLFEKSRMDQIAAPFRLFTHHLAS